jgi:hypothetical protein
MMTKERLREIKRLWTSYAPEDVRERNNGRGYVHVLELVAEVERLRRVVENAVDIAIIESRKKEPVFHWDGKNFVPHVGPPDTTPCVQVPCAHHTKGFFDGEKTSVCFNCGERVPLADARDGGL